MTSSKVSNSLRTTGSFSSIASLINGRAAYGISIADSHLPVVNVGNRENPTYLPAEVCYVMPGQPANTKLDPKQTQQMIRFAVRKPWENATFITKQGVETAGLLPSTNPRLVKSPFAASLE
ncbi:PAZ domain-containing protein [Ilyonectria sp. MPI-CAGE-AT-0026]|nr:PAZ domain-containing protein [Ilyonectria sp. MPI-CAGE-AT-0026]